MNSGDWIIYRKIALISLWIAICLVSGALADTYVGGLPLATVQNGTVSGGVYMDADNDWWPSSPGVQEVEKTFNAIPDVDDIEWARLYIGVYIGHMQNNYPGLVEVEFDGDGDSTFDDLSTTETLNVAYTFSTNGGNDNSGFSGHGTGEPYKMVNEHCIRVTSDYVMWYDIDPADITSTEPRAHVTTSGTTIDGRIKLITLVIAYNDGDTDTIRYWVNQGQDAVTYYSDSDTPGLGETGSTEFDLSDVETVESASLMVNHMASSDGYYWWLGEQLDRPADSSSQGSYFGWDIWDITDFVDTGYANDLLYDRSCEGSGEYSGQFFKIPLAILTIREQAAAEPPVTDFTALPLSGETPLTVQFADESTNTPTSWKWEYRLGTGIWTQFATTQNPEYSFSSVGTYSIRMTATNDAGSNTKTRSAYITVNAPSTPDLTITNVRPITNTVFAKEPNSVRITVKNIGGSASTATTVVLDATDGFSGSADVPALASDEQVIITIVDTTIHDVAGGSVTFTATIDPENTVAEASEVNNVVDSMAYTVKYNGYKGKRYWEGGSDVTTARAFDLRGGLLHSSGDSTYHSGAVSGSGWSAYTVTWTAGDLPIPTGASVKEARLYVPYTWDNSDEIPDRFHLTFNGISQTPDNHYEDVSNFGGYATYDYGLLAYNVTSLFSPSGNTAYISKDSASTTVSTYGVTLAVVYEDTAATRKQIFLNEEFDLLGASEGDYATTEEEATAYVPFSSLDISPSAVTSAELITFVPSGNMNEGDLLYNGVTIATDVWDYGSVIGSQVAVDTRDVKTYLTADDNIVGIRSTAGATPCMAAAQEFLVLSYTDAPVAAFSANATSGTAPLSVRFSDESSGSITTFAWDFNNDGTVDSTLENPEYTYQTAGTYTVNLTITGPGGTDTELKSAYITVTESQVAPVAAFTASATSGLSPLSVTFTDQSTNTPTEWKWEYKAGTGDWTQFSTLQNPTYIFTVAGTYDIRLTATNSAGSDDETKTHLFAVSAGREPLTTIASGTVSGDLYVGAFQPVSWTNQPSSGVTSRDFDQSFSIPASAIGGIQWAGLFVNTYSGSATNGYGHTAIITFDGDGDGTFETTLGTETCDIAAEGNGNSYPLNDHVTKVFSDYEAWYNVTSLVTSTHPAAHVRTEQVTGKSYDGRLKAVTLVVAYNDGDSDHVMYWVNHGQDWINSGTSQTTFATGGVTPGFASAVGKNLAISSADGRYTFNGVEQSWENPVSPVNYFEFHTWDLNDEISPGTGSTLVYSMGAGTSFKNTLSTLAIACTTQLPVADFIANATSGYAPLPVQFTDQSTGSITSYAWDFNNDGTIDSTLQNPVHTYQDAGTYTVNLTVTGPGGSDSELKTNYITASGSLQPDLEIIQLTTNSGELFAHESNTINATVRNNGTAASGAFSVRIDASGAIYDVPLSGLDPGAQVEVQVTDTTLRAAGDSVTITATADSGLVVPESDETNNVVSLTKVVVNNGYKGKRWTGGPDMTTHATFMGQYDVVYSAGNSAYHATKWLEANATWTADDLPIPAGATVASARLYQPYAYNKKGTDPAFSASFNGNTVSPVATYSDIKGYASYSYPYGLYVYDVTSLFDTAGNTLLLTPEGTPGTTNDYSLYGAYLVVTYIDPATTDKQILINDEFDMVYAGSARSVTSDEATAYADFSELDTSDMADGTAVAILASAGDSGKSRFFFNSNEYTGFWTDYMSGPQIGFSVFDVTGALTTGENEARLQSYDAGSGGDNMYAMTAILIVEYSGSGTPDLTVTEILPNVGAGDDLFASEPNVLSVNVTNIGDADAGPSTLLIDVSGTEYTAAVSALSAGASEIVIVTDTVCRAAGMVTVTATLDSAGVIDESDETNNSLTVDLAIYNNGYKGKRWTGGSDMTTQATFDGQYDILYSAGDTAYAGSGWTESTFNWTASDLPIPSSATVVSARLYQGYTYNKMGVDPAFTMTFNGATVTPGATYSDIKGFGSYSYPYGLYVYDVTGEFDPAGNSMTVTPETGNNYGIYGAYLVVVCSDPATTEKQIWINEECDMVYSRPSYSVNDTEATVYAPFSGVDMTGMESATAVAILASAGDADKSKFFFNSQEYSGFWDDYMATPQVGFSIYDVTGILTTGENEALFQSYDAGSGGDNMYALTAILIVEGTAPAPVADFTASPLSGTAPLEVHFTDKSTGSITSFAWDFTNDGTVDSTEQNPVYTYTAAGTYTVNLAISGPGGSDSEVKAGYITVSGPSGDITAGFSAIPREGDPPLLVRFTDESTGTITSRQWDFDNDGRVDSIARNPIYFYRAPGVYSVRLVVSGSGGSDQLVKEDYITVGGPSGEISAGFFASPLEGGAPLLVRFTDESTGTITSRQWDFDNDGRVDSIARNPIYFYRAPGVYSVRLVVSGSGGSDQLVKEDYITVGGSMEPLRARFTQDVRYGVPPLTVGFTDLSTGDPSSYLWSFGDGETSTDTNPTHTYSAPGLYRVSLTVSNEGGSSTIGGFVFAMQRLRPF